MSDTFSICGGIRQGCPVSALLFVLATEILALKVRKHPTLKGFDIGCNKRYLKISQYADDAIMFFTNKSELCTAFSMLNEFGKLAGTKLNMKKCEGMWIGVEKDKQKNCSLFGIRWPDSIKYLGLCIGHYRDKNHKAVGKINLLKLKTL